MTLPEIREGWDHAAREDAFFNILTIPGKDHGRWDPDEFFQRGRDEIREVLDKLERFKWLGPMDRALDFGCGVGRLTQALDVYYKHAVGVDVSEEMVKQARKWARHYCKQVVFKVNTKPDLSLFEDGHFDLVYSMITLQHMANDLQQGYIREFIRLLSPDGIACFQLPEGEEYHHPHPWLSMFCATPGTVAEWIGDAGGVLLDVEVSEASGGGFTGWRYTAVRA